MLTASFHSLLPLVVLAIVGCRFVPNRRFKSLIVPTAFLACLLALPLILVQAPFHDVNRWNEIFRIGLQSKVYAYAAICIVMFEVLCVLKRNFFAPPGSGREK